MSGCRGDHCVTCSDEGIAMRVLALDAQRGLALCAADGDGGSDGAHATVEVALVAPVAPGDALLVHAGVALARLQAAP